jgi:hypothetical protein
MEVLSRLREVVCSGGIIVGAGAGLYSLILPLGIYSSCREFTDPKVDVDIGIGLSAKSVEKGGCDLIIIYNSGRFRMAGRGSLAGLMPYGDANQIVVEMVSQLMYRPNQSSTTNSFLFSGIYCFYHSALAQKGREWKRKLS